MTRFTALLAFVVIFSSELFAQQYVQYFRGQYDAVKKDVNLYWTVPAGLAPCYQYQLQRSTDSVNFDSFYQVVNTFNGTMGLPSSSQQFYDHDTLPVMHMRNYYRVQPTGGYYSEIIGVDAGELANNYHLTPSPICDISKLEFTNKDNAAYVLEIANPKGTMLYHFEEITTNYFYINASWFEKTGSYFFRMYKPDGSGLIKGKFIVVKP